MFKNLEELKSFMIWCKDQKVTSVSVDNISFNISELNFLPEESNSENKDLSNEALMSSLIDDEKVKDWREDPDLFYSAK